MQFDIEKFSKALNFFRTSFVEHWEDEKYKWQAVKQFQDNWNINADDFYAMFEKATKKSNNLLDSRNFLPRGMILEFSKENPEKTRQMFEILFDENKSLSQRIEKFKNIADELQKNHNQNSSSKWKSHFQTDNAISTYLWLRYPNKYYIYKWSEYRNVAKELDCPMKFTKGHKENLENGFALYDSICKELAKDEEIKNLLKSKLSDDCYSDDALKTLTIDFGFQISRYYNDGEWLPKDYNPGISKEKWIELINDKNAFSENSLVTFACIQNAKIATCADMAKEFGRNANFYNNGNWQTGERIHKKINCPLSEREIDGVRYWAVCCLARETKDKLWEFKIRPELQAAFDETGILNNIELYENGENDMARRYWVARLTNDEYWANAINENLWYCQQRYGFQATAAVTNFLNKVKEVSVNDVIFLAYSNRLYSYGVVCPCPFETNQITSLEKIISDKSYEYKSGIVRFTDTNTFYEDLRNGEESWGQRICVEKWQFYDEYSEVNTYGIKDFILSGVVQESIFEITKDYGESKMKELEAQFENKKKISEKMAKLLQHTHNLILHGAPGTGKTYLAHKIAKAMGCSDNEIGFVQFHPSYDYTDFVEGLRPVNDGGSGQIGFERKDGVFKKFCEKALKNLKDSEKTTEQISKEISIDEETEDFLSSAIDENIEFNIVTGNKFFVTDFNEKNIYISIPENEKVKELVLQRLELSSLLNAEVNIENGTAVREFFKRKWRTQQDSYVFALYKEINQKLSPAEQISNVQRIEKKNFIFIIDEINRGEMSKIFGELFFSIDPGYRGKDGLIKTQYQNLITESNVFYNGFYVPENVYIIGTMNDIDRNVESMDFAFRRRFTFKEITAKDTQEQILSGLDYSIREEAIKRMDSLNDAISKVEGLSSSYHIGGAYFLKLKDFDGTSDERFSQLWDYHLEGLLREYLRGMENEEDELDKLKKAYENDNLMKEK